MPSTTSTRQERQAVEIALEEPILEGECLCGCRQPVTRRFLPGHDARLKGRLLRLARGTDPADALVALRVLGWDRLLTGNRTTRRAARADTAGRRFGIEIELQLPRGMSRHTLAGRIAAASIPCEAENYNHHTRRHWKVTTDSSIGGNGAEVVSPPMSGADGLAQLATVLQVLRDAGCTVDVRCGIHVHIEASGMDRRQIAAVVRFYADRQSTFSAFQPPSRRDGRWCRDLTERHMAAVDSAFADSDNYQLRYMDRYRSVNVASYPKYGTIEHRQMAGSLSTKKITAWVELLLAMFAAVVEARPVGTSISEMLLELDLPEWVRTHFARRAAAFGFAVA